MNINHKAMFEPKTTDKPYTTDQLKISLILRVDSYKFSHHVAYPNKNIQGMTSYGEARVPASQAIIPFGMQLFLKRYLTQRITMKDIDDAEAFTEAHFGKKLLARADFERVVTEFGGALPLVIRSVPEGMRVRGGDPLYTVTVVDDQLFWMSAAFETMIQRAIWYPTTIATMDWHIRNRIKEFYTKTGANMGLLPFALHDFGGRGVTSAEQAEIGGAAHTVNFMGSDTVEGILTANHYYKDPMSAFSVYATEHSIEIAFGPTAENEIDYIRHQLREVKRLGLPIVSIVLDGFDIYRAVELCCTVLRDEIIACGAKVVFRPDSGDMMEVVPRILNMQALAFGTTLTSTGHRQINHVGVIQGDGVNHDSIVELLTIVTGLGYAADTVIFGSGGALLQKVNRDTLKFAQKASAILIDDVWVPVSKNPVTDPGKRSKSGLLTLGKAVMNNELGVYNLSDPKDHWVDMMQLVYHTGTLYNETTLAEVRSRANPNG